MTKNSDAIMYIISLFISYDIMTQQPAMFNLQQSSNQRYKLVIEEMEKGKQEESRVDQFEFKQSVSKGEICAILSPALKKVVQREQWHLGDREYRDLNAALFIAQLQSTNLKVLWLDFNKITNILQEIAIPIHHFMHTLYLGDNNINSLEPLIQLNAPDLQKLYLNHNKIVSLRPLRMTYFPKLNELNLNGNYIENQELLTQCSFSSASKIHLGYPNKKQELFDSKWFLKADIKDQTNIQSAKNKLGSFTRKMYVSMIFDGGKKSGEAKNLFKTFEN